MEYATKTFKRYDRSLELGRQQTLPLAQARGARVRCLRGTLWITQEGDREDHIVGAGGSFTVMRDGVTLVSAAGGTGTVLVTRPALRNSAFARWLEKSRNYLLNPGECHEPH